MPWSSNKDLPKRTKKFASTSNKKRAFRHAFESAQEQGHDESSRWAIATAAAKRAGRKGKKTEKSFKNYYHQLLVEAGLMDEPQDG